MNEVEMLQDLVKKLRHDTQTAQQQQVDNLSPQELAMQEGADEPFQSFDPYISLNTLLEVQPQHHSSPISVVGGREQEQAEPECTPPSSLTSVDNVSTNIVDLSIQAHFDGLLIHFLKECDTGSLRRGDSEDKGSIQFKKQYYVSQTTCSKDA